MKFSLHDKSIHKSSSSLVGTFFNYSISYIYSVLGVIMTSIHKELDSQYFSLTEL